MTRKILFLFLFIVVLALPGNPVRAQTSKNLTLSVAVGFANACKENTVIPLRILVENKGAGMEAQVRVTTKDFYSNNIYTASVSLPTTSRKEFFHYISAPAGIRKATVSILADGSVVAEKEINIDCYDSSTHLIGVLSDDPDLYQWIGNKTSALHGGTKTLPLKLEDLPVRAAAWEALEALVVSGADMGPISAGQRQALNEWLTRGGVLFAIGGSSWQAMHAGLAEFLPIKIQSTSQQTDFATLASFLHMPDAPAGPAVAAVGTAQPGAETLVDGLLWRKKVGFGLIYYLSVDPALEPLSDWQRWGILFDAILAVPAARPAWIGGPYNTDQQNQALSALPEMMVPGVEFIMLWLCCYLFVLGPLNYFILRAIKRREWAWVSIPVIALLFMGLAYGTGFQFRGFAPVLNRIAIIQAWEGQPTAQVYGLLGVYSPVRQSLDVDLENGFFPISMPNQASTSTQVVENGDSNLLSGLQMEIGGMRPFVLHGSMPAIPIEHTLKLEINDQRPRLSGSVTNRGSQALRNVYLVSPAAEYRLGDLAPGQSRTISLQFTNPQAGSTDFYNFDPGSLLNVSYSDLNDDVNTARKAALLQSFIENYPRQAKANWGIYLIGWLDDNQAVLPVSIRGTLARPVDTSLYAYALNPQVEIARQEPVMLHPALFSWDAGGQINPFQYELSSNYAEIIRYRLEISPGMSKIKSMNLNLNVDAASQSQQQIRAALWNFSTRKWDTVLGDYDGLLDVPSPELYFGPLGEIRLQVSSNQQGWTSIYSPSLTVLVEP